MLSRQNRLHLDKDFDRVFKQGRGFYGRFLSLKIKANDLPINRFGILVGTKVSKKAVDRNKIKRRIRAILRAENQQLKPGYDIVIVVFPLILAKKYKEIKEDLKNACQRLKLYV
jgi:ribonuclease P protein component